MSQPPEEDSTTLLSIATRLLEMQQRMAAFDRLYNQEIADLSQGLADLKNEFVQHHLRPAIALDVAAGAKRPRRKPADARSTRSSRGQSVASKSSVEKE